jgi:hypothetical protein
MNCFIFSHVPSKLPVQLIFTRILIILSRTLSVITMLVFHTCMITVMHKWVKPPQRKSDHQWFLLYLEDRIQHYRRTTPCHIHLYKLEAGCCSFPDPLAVTICNAWDGFLPHPAAQIFFTSYVLSSPTSFSFLRRFRDSDTSSYHQHSCRLCLFLYSEPIDFSACNHWYHHLSNLSELDLRLAHSSWKFRTQ